MRLKTVHISNRTKFFWNDLVAVEGKRVDVEGSEVITVSVNGDSNH